QPVSKPSEVEIIEAPLALLLSSLDLLELKSLSWVLFERENRKISSFDNLCDLSASAPTSSSSQALPKIPVSSIGVTFETSGSVNAFLKGENHSNRCSSNALEASTSLTGDDRSSLVQDGPAPFKLTSYGFIPESSSLSLGP
ncbi:hypothetical protein Tco_1205337, partial [Tanacetum coccineum]